MLWYKAWLEMRWRALLLLAVMTFVLYQVHAHTPNVDARGLLGALQYMWVIVPITLAGSGIRPECPLRAVKGIQGSMSFTLSLPVSRFRLLAARALYGLLMTAAVIVVTFCVAAMVMTPIRSQVSLANGLRYVLAIFVCGWAAYGVSSAIATVLDQQWQGFAAMFIMFFGRFLFETEAPASQFDFFQAMGSGSPLNTHGIPWAAMSTSCGVALLFMAVAVLVERTRQY